MDSSHHKIFLDVGKYIYRYQFRFLKNIIKSDRTFTSSNLREYMDKFIIYNLISDIEYMDNDAASLVWFEEEESVAFQFPQEGKITQALSNVGYDLPELDTYEEDDDWV
jgi:hypothetical protein